MSLAVLTSVLLAVVPPPITVAAPHGEPYPVPGYSELTDGRPAEAIEILSERYEDDPAQLINLGTAYARVGDASKAERLYKAAVHSENRTDLLLGDGRVMDSRAAARLALKSIAQVRVASR